MRHLIQLLMLVSAVCAASQAHAAIFTVGRTADCDIHPDNLASAVAAANDFDVFRLADVQIITRLIVTEREIQIEGRWPSCSAAASDGEKNGRTIVSGDGENPVIEVIGGDGRNTGSSDSGTVPLRPYNVDLIGLQLENGGGFIGGGLSVSGAASVRLLGTVISSNEVENSGAGIFVTGPLASVRLIGSRVQGNIVGLFGGGIYCTNQASVTMDELSGVSNNASRLDGGGVYAEDCRFASSGSIFLNSARRNGGGIHASRGAKVDLTGEHVTSLVQNRADSNGDAAGDGGAIFATGEGTDVIAENVLIWKNRAHRGGGLFATTNARVAVRRNLSGVCGPIGDGIEGLPPSEAAIGCNAMLENAANSIAAPATAQRGAELMVEREAAVTISQTSIFNFDPNPGAGREARETIFVGEDGSLRIDSSLIGTEFSGGVGPNAVFRLEADPASAPRVFVSFSSIVARGDAPNAMFAIEGGDLSLLGSVIASDRPAPLLASSGNPSPNIEQAIARNVSFPPNALGVVTTPLALFRNPARWDYRLRDHAGIIALSRDKVFDVIEDGRGDRDLRPRLQGPGVDIGPNEFPPAAGDGIFVHNFERRSVPRFSEELVSAFAHPRCVTCHTAARFEEVVSNRFAHTGQDLATCNGGCHGGLGEQDLSNWHAPLDLRLAGLSSRQLCNLAKRDPHPGEVSARKHLTEDPLILWAVSDGEVPGGGASGGLVVPATQLTTQQWIDRINNWFETGAHCD